MNNIRHKRRFFTIFSLFLALAPVFSQISFHTGEELFLQNKPSDAIEHLEAAIREDPAHVQAFIYLGIAYQQLNRPTDAITVYLRILPRAGADAPKVAYNLANAYFSAGFIDEALTFYSQALKADPSLSSAYLNRANSLVRKGSKREAINDYQKYLELEPESVQKGEIERLINFILSEFAEEERLKAQAEDNSRTEADRRQRFIEEVASSLQSLAEDSMIFSSWAPDIESFDEIEDIEPAQEHAVPDEWDEVGTADILDFLNRLNLLDEAEEPSNEDPLIEWPLNEELIEESIEDPIFE